jgi:hypothetical protein
MASFFGGPFAAVQVLRENFQALEQPARSRSSLLWGAGFIGVLLAILPFLPEGFPNTFIPLVYSLIVGELVKKYQLSKEQIEQSEVLEFQSNWRVVGVSVIAFLSFLVLVAAWLFALAYVGVIDLT